MGDVQDVESCDLNTSSSSPRRVPLFGKIFLKISKELNFFHILNYEYERFTLIRLYIIKSIKSMNMYLN